MLDAYICDAIRTPIGRYGGALAGVRADDLGAIPLRALVQRNQSVDWEALDDVVFGCANQAGEDNRNVARMSLLLADLPSTTPGSTVNRLCGSGLDALAIAARAIKSGEARMMMAGGVENMSRAPFVVPKSSTAFGRQTTIEDTTIGWRFINKNMKNRYGVHSMPETAENVAEEFQVSRADQDAFALRSQQRAKRAMASKRLANEIVPTPASRPSGETVHILADEHPRETSIALLSKLRPVVREGGTVTAGNSSGVNDGACAILLASAAAAAQHGLTPRARVLGCATAGIEPRIMGMGPGPATRKILEKLGLQLGQIDVIELNEAFAAQALAVTRSLGLPDDAEHVNPNGGAIALGHPLGMSGARLALTALHELESRKKRYALCTMCIGVGQGIAIVIERV